MSEYKCNLVLAGFPKSGTSSLHRYLDLHPHIVMSIPKEPHFFSVENVWKKGSAFHNSLFKPTKEKFADYYGESSTTYCISEIAMQRISKKLVAPKIILVMRNPVERVVSHYRWMSALALEKDSFLDAIKNNGIAFNPNMSIEGNYKSYLQFSAYSKYVPKWQKMFGENNVLVLFTDELAKNQNVILARCFEFLNLMPIGPITEIQDNRTENSSRLEPRHFAKVAKYYLPKSISSALKKLLPTPSILKFVANFEVSSEPLTVCSSDIAKLSEIMKEEIIYFNQLRERYSLLKL